MEKRGKTLQAPLCSFFYEKIQLILGIALSLCPIGQCLCQSGTSIDTLFIQIETEGEEAKFLIYGNEEACCDRIDLDISIKGLSAESQLTEVIAPDLSWSTDYTLIYDPTDSTWMLHLRLENEDGLDFREKPIEIIIDIGTNDGFPPGSLVLGSNGGGTSIIMIDNASFKERALTLLTPYGNGWLMIFDTPINGRITIMDTQGRIYQKRSIAQETELYLPQIPLKAGFLIIILEKRNGDRDRWKIYHER